MSTAALRHAPAVASALTACLVAFTLVGCPSGDLCSQAPLCQDLDDGTHQQTVNCEPSCTVGPCTTGAQFHRCAEGTTCRFAGAIPGSEIAFRPRAVCEVSADQCDPAAAATPTCDGLGTIRGCSEYGRVIEAACTQARLFFRDFACCAHLPDGGAGAPDAGDAGTATDGGT